MEKQGTGAVPPKGLYNLNMAELLARQSSARAAGPAPRGKKTIGIDGRVMQFEPSMVRGIGHYTVNHLSAVIRQKPDWDFIFCFEEMGTLPKPLEEFLRLPNVSWSKFDELKVPLDLLHIPDLMSPVGFYDSAFRLYPKGPFSVTFYDLTPYVLRDLHFDCWSDISRLGYLSRIKRLGSSDTITLAISEFTRKDLLERFKLPPENIASIMAGVNSSCGGKIVSQAKIDYIKQSLGLDKPFFLWVGAFDAHKNFSTALLAYRLAKQSVDMNLVVLGCGAGSNKQHIQSQLARHNVDGVIFPGFLPREDLDALYQCASGLVFPSLYEGFGFPVLEAMAHGCPVICSASTSMPEVAGEAAILMDPNSAEGFARAMARLASEPKVRELLREAGLRQAAKFSWELTAKKTIAAWESLLSKRISIEVVREARGAE